MVIEEQEDTDFGFLVKVVGVFNVMGFRCPKLG